jgi:hypothetical protein
VTPFQHKPDGTWPTIQSIGAPHEIHADRIISEMLVRMAKEQAEIWPQIKKEIESGKDGSPEAQLKLRDRVIAAGAVQATLVKSGKRGRYVLDFYDWTGWDWAKDHEIMQGDPIPPKPGIAVWLNKVKGLGRRQYDYRAKPLIFVTHHACSRLAQRCGARDADDLLAATCGIWNAAIELLHRSGWDAWLAPPPKGWRIPFKGGEVSLVRHENPKRSALVATTIYEPKGEEK